MPCHALRSNAPYPCHHKRPCLSHVYSVTRWAFSHGYSRTRMWLKWIRKGPGTLAWAEPCAAAHLTCKSLSGTCLHINGCYSPNSWNYPPSVISIQLNYRFSRNPSNIPIQDKEILSVFVSFVWFCLVLSWNHCLTFATSHSQDRRRTPPDYERPDDIVHELASAPFPLHPALFTKGLLRGIQ